ncbi:MAG: hypothetical protein J6T58_00280 [Bacteroidales bacterium]|nr:hypothetical protein [Bacteroidales bacterium]
MKRFAVIFLLLISVALSSAAQNRYRNEIAVTYAPLSDSDLQGFLLKYIGQAISKDAKVQMPGTFGIEYFRSLGDLVSVGAMGSVYLFFSQEKGKKDFNYANYSLMAGVKLHWYQREWFAAYSKFGVGASYLGYKKEDESPVHFAFQASLLGVEVGKRLCGFVEAGVGDQGVALVGVRYRF